MRYLVIHYFPIRMLIITTVMLGVYRPGYCQDSPTTNGAAPIESPRKPQVEKFDLLNLVDTKRNTLRGVWRQEGRSLVGEPEGLLSIPYELPESYELRMRVTRTEFDDTVFVGFMVAGKLASLAIDVEHSRYTGLFVDQREPQQPHCVRIPGARLPLNVPTDVVITVHRNNVQLQMAGREVFNWYGDARRLWAHPTHVQNMKPGLFLALSRAKIDVTRMEITPLIATDTHEQKPQQHLDLLAGLQFDRDSLRGGWKREDGSLQNVATDSAIVFHSQLSSRYLLTFAVQRLARTDGNDQLRIGLPTAGGLTHLVIDAERGMGLERLNGRAWDSGPTFITGQYLPLGKPMTYRIAVTDAGIYVKVDGTPCVNWTEGWQTLTTNADLAHPDARKIGLNVHGRFAVAGAKLEPLAKSDFPELRGDNRIPLPEGMASTIKLNEIRVTFAKDYAKATSPSRKAELARQLSKVANESKNDSVAYYVLLQEVKLLATESEQIDLACEVIEKLTDSFAIDRDVQYCELLESYGSMARFQSHRQQLIEIALDISNESVIAERIDQANRLLLLASGIGRQLESPQIQTLLRERLEHISWCRESIRLQDRARILLEANAANPEAHRIIGEYLCFLKQQWNDGFEHLEKCDSPLLKAISVGELSELGAASEQLNLADQWMELSRSVPGLAALAKSRAQAWYVAARPKLTGLDRARVEKQLRLLSGG